MEKEYAVNWVGAIFLVLALGSSVAIMIWASNEFGNQLAKKCIDKQGDWVLTDRQYSKFECHFK